MNNAVPTQLLGLLNQFLTYKYKGAEYGTGYLTTDPINIDSYKVSIDLAGNAAHGGYEDEFIYIEYAVDGVGDGLQNRPQFST